MDEDIEISAVILDKATILKAPLDPEQLYREIVMQVVRDCVERHPRLEIWFDKRYTNSALRDRLERTVRDGIADLAQQSW